MDVFAQHGLFFNGQVFTFLPDLSLPLGCSQFTSSSSLSLVELDITFTLESSSRSSSLVPPLSNLDVSSTEEFDSDADSTRIPVGSQFVS